MVPGTAAQVRIQAQSKHLARVYCVAALLALLCITIGVYGYDYYTLPAAERPFSGKHELLRPSGLIGINLGILGTALFCFLYLYALRRAVPFLGRIGTARQWMDFHVIIGMTAPVIADLHASFKFNNIAGAAFWIMLAVAFSGVIGRYIYSQIPRSLNAAELSYQELEEREEELSDALARQTLYDPMYLQKIFAMPSAEHVRTSPVAVLLLEMLFLDLARPFKLAMLRRKEMRAGAILFSLGGLLRMGSPELESIIRQIRAKSSLSKRILFLDRTQRIFHLWHVIHRPFSYAFAVLALIHIVNAIRMGYF
jgi:hypothetical protein